MSDYILFSVKENETGMRLDQFLASIFQSLLVAPSTNLKISVGISGSVGILAQHQLRSLCVDF